MTEQVEIKLKDVIVTYRRLPAVHHVSGVFTPGSLTAIAGPNGAGKSTLLKAIMGLVAVGEGSISRTRAKASHAKTQDFAYLPQLPEIDRSFPISVLQTVLLGAWPRTGALRAIGREEHERAHAAIGAVGLQGYSTASVSSLSIGQWHRALFARLIMQDAPVILLDEPFAAVDERTISDLISLIHRWQNEGRSVIAVLHDMHAIRAHFPNTLLLARELVAWGKTEEVLSQSNIERARSMTDRWARDDHHTTHHAHAKHAHRAHS